MDKDLWLINFATFTAIYGFWVAVTWGPTFLKVERGFSLLESGLYTGLVAITAVPAGVFWGKISDNFGRKKLAMLLLPFSALSLYMLTRVMSPAGVIIVFLVFGLTANSAFAPVMVAWLGDLFNTRYPGYIGAVAGIHNCAIMSSAIVAPVLSGLLRDYTGSLTPAISFGAFLMLIGTIVMSRIPENRVRKNIAVTEEVETA
jgi:MFS family permease